MREKHHHRIFSYKRTHARDLHMYVKFKLERMWGFGGKGLETVAERENGGKSVTLHTFI